MTWRVIVGTLSFVLTMILFGYVAVSEQDRMATFDTAYQARLVETGGQLFENNCATCHGLDGKGSGRAIIARSFSYTPSATFREPGLRPASRLIMPPFQGRQRRPSWPNPKSPSPLNRRWASSKR